jgi:DNA-binding transcriptional LysR family regulator
MLTAVSNPDLHLLRVFKTITETGGFSAAQFALNVSQSTISTQMADLEARLGLKLCRRGRSGFSLTEDGHVIFEAANELFRSCDRFTEQVNKRRGSLTGELRLALADALVGSPDFEIDALLTQVRAAMPQVSLVLESQGPLEIERNVLEQQLHAGIHTFPNHAPGLRYLPLFTENQTLYCGATHPLFFRDDHKLTLKEVESFDYAARSYYGGALNLGSFRPSKSTARCSSMEAIAAFILSGDYIGHLPEQVAQPWLDRGLMRAVLPDQTAYGARFECVISVGAQIGRPLEVFEQVLRAHLARAQSGAGTSVS